MNNTQTDFVTQLETALKTRFLGRRALYFPELGSTNTSALQLAKEKVGEGTLIIADSQSAGRGQKDRQWYSPPGVNLYFSLILYPDLPITSLISLTLCIGTTLAGHLGRLSGKKIYLKWPNDLYVQGKKLGGILLEAAGSSCGKIQYLVAGIGLNINQPAHQFPLALQANATSLAIQTGHVFERTVLLAQILMELEKTYCLYLERGFSPFLSQFEPLDYLAGKTLQIKTAQGILEGRALGINSDGALLLQEAGNDHLLHKIVSGTICSF
ncbi:MAG: biotin--[acetyl-CoA-carboxylase] ligase [Candidatus Schekmanbacteria bacterium]|nr:biotin--[acetyl-CoA-carboxylase] ligase [Candidatus Schekmanbacteria bacterium]